MANRDQEETLENSIPADASISNLSRPIIRLLGSIPQQQSTQALELLPRRPPDGDGDGGPGDDGDGHPPPPPPPPVSSPDLAIQISSCLPVQLNNPIIDALRQAFGSGADVRTACINQTQRIGIWLLPSGNPQDDQARNRGLSRLNILGTGETLTFFINSTLIRRKAQDGWNAAPKRLNGDGKPDSGGPLHLTGFSLRFESPNRIITQVEGFDERPWPDVSFKLTITDTLSSSGGQVRCESKRDLDVDTSWLNFLTGLFSVILPPLGIVFLIERIIIASVDTPNVNAGAGCGAAGMIPQEILIPGGQKVVANYTRVEISSGGIYAGGSFAVIPRSPEVTVTGPSQVSIVERTPSLSRTFSLHASDLRPPLQIAWSGEGSPASPTAETTSFRFNLGGAEVGQVLTRRVTARVTDADGLVGSGDLIVQIHIIPADDDGLPPICRVKPWLPQCQEPLAAIISQRGGQQP